MKQFSLNEYLANPSRKVVTRDGHSVRIICTDANRFFPIVALIEENGQESIFCYLSDGVYIEGKQDSRDLFFAPEQKERFDPHTLQPFDKVLARDLDDGFWTCAYFSHINEDNKSFKYCATIHFKYCIPYNDETKHLIGTKDEAPEYYRYWEE